MRLCDITPGRIEEFVSRLKQTPKQPQNPKKAPDPKVTLSVTTVRAAGAQLKSIMSYADDMELLTKNPAKRMRLPAPDEKEATAWSEEEVEKFLLVANKHYLYGTLWQVWLALGVRIGEIAGLMWKNVDLDNRTVYVKQQALMMEPGTQFGVTKSRAGKAVVPIAKHIAETLRLHMVDQDMQREVCGTGWNPDDLVFPSSVGTRLSASRVRVIFNRLAENAGVRHIRLHDLRHTNGTIGIAGGASPNTMKNLLRHRDIETTLGTYVHATPVMEREAVEMIAERMHLKSADAAAPPWAELQQ